MQTLSSCPISTLQSLPVRAGERQSLTDEIRSWSNTMQEWQSRRLAPQSQRHAFVELLRKRVQQSLTKEYRPKQFPVPDVRAGRSGGGVGREDSERLAHGMGLPA